MKRLAILSLVLVAGCGSNLGGVGSNVARGVSLAEARATCLAWDNEPGLFDAFVLIAEAARDDGITELEFLQAFIPSCSPTVVQDQAGCIACSTQVGAAVYN